MKKTVLFTAFILFHLFIYAQSQVPNGNFENWSDIYTPDSWSTTNKFIAGGSYPVAKVSNDPYGNAIMLQSISYFGNIVPGVATLGEVGLGYVQGGISFNMRPNRIKGMLKHPSVGDSVSLIVYFTKWNGSESVTIGRFTYTVHEQVNEFSPFDLEIEYLSNDIPDSMNMVLLTQMDVVGSTMWVDELEFDYTAGKEEGESPSGSFLIYPNPVSKYEMLGIVCNFNCTYVNVYGQEGRLVKSEPIQKGKSFLDLNGLESGFYNVLVLDGDKNRYQKLVIQ